MEAFSLANCKDNKWLNFPACYFSDSYQGSEFIKFSMDDVWESIMGSCEFNVV
jgi:hypothetical protein